MDIFKKRAEKTEEAKEAGLYVMKRGKYLNTTPQKAWARWMGTWPKEASQCKVYADVLLWLQAGKNGMPVNFFLVYWPLVLCSYVDDLKSQEQKDQWHNIFVGNALEKLYDMVHFFEVGYDGLPAGTISRGSH